MKRPTWVAATSFQRPAVTAVFLTIVVAACTSPTPAPTSGRPSPTITANRSSDGESVLFMQGRTLKRFDLDDGRAETLGRLPGPDVAASQVGPWIAYVVGTSSSADDFIEAPSLHLRNLDGEEDIDLGFGFGPLWHPSATRLAYLRPVDERRCDAERCLGGTTIMIAEPGSAPREVAPASHWGLLGWAGDRVLAADARDLARTVAVGSEPASIDFPPSEIWDASPDGRWLVTAGPGATGFWRLEGAEVAGDQVPVDLGVAALGDGAWAPDSSKLAATLVARGPPRVAVISPTAPEPAGIEGSRGAVGSVLWAPSGRAVTIVRTTAGGRRLEAAYCRLVPERPCRSLFSWSHAVVLLRME